MEEFTNYAIWILMVFLSVNAAIIWFADTSTFDDNGFATGIQTDDTYNTADVNALTGSFFGVSCDTANSNVLLYAPCALIQAQLVADNVIGSIWGLLTRWQGLLTSVLSPLPGGALIVGILIPFFSLIQIMAILVIILKLAQIVRGTA